MLLDRFWMARRMDPKSLATALCTLRFILGQIGVERANDYRTHDLRRGHAQDLVESGMESDVGAPYSVMRISVRRATCRDPCGW